MKYFRKVICSIIGHRFIKITEHDNGRSKYGRFECQRCDKEKDYQFDYMV